MYFTCCIIIINLNLNSTLPKDSKLCTACFDNFHKFILFVCIMCRSVQRHTWVLMEPDSNNMFIKKIIKRACWPSDLWK